MQAYYYSGVVIPGFIQKNVLVPGKKTVFSHTPVVPGENDCFISCPLFSSHAPVFTDISGLEVPKVIYVID